MCGQKWEAVCNATMHGPIAANISKFQLVMKPTKTKCPLVSEAILHDSTRNTRRMLKLFSLPIAHLHSGGHHDETVGSSLVPVYYPLLHRTNRYPDKQGIDTTLIDILFGNSELIYYSTLCQWMRRRLFGCPDFVSLTRKLLMARILFRILTENKPVRGLRKKQYSRGELVKAHNAMLTGRIIDSPLYVFLV